MQEEDLPQALWLEVGWFTQMSSLSVMCSFPYHCFTQGLSISTVDSSTGVLTPGQTASISLPQQIISLIPMGSDDIRLAFTAFTEADLFPVRNEAMRNGHTVVGSSVISAIVDGVQDGTQLPAPVEVLLLLSDVGPNETASSRTCVFWDFSAAGRL